MPNIGVVSVELVNSSVLVICLVTPLCTIGIRSAPAPAVATGNAEMAMSVILVVSCEYVEALTSSH